METQVKRTETNAPGVHSVREVQTTTNTNTNAQSLPGIVGAGLKSRTYGRDHVVTKQQFTYLAPVVLAVLLALTLLYLRSHEMFPWHHTPTLQEKISNQYADVTGKARDAAKMAQETYAGKKATEYAKDGADWIASQGLKEKLAEGYEDVKEKVKETLHVGKDMAEERARQAAERSYTTRAKEWMSDKVNEVTDTIGNTVGSATENIKHSVESLKENARHSANIAEEEIRHQSAKKAYEYGDSINEAKVKAHDTKRSLKDKAASKIAEHL